MTTSPSMFEGSTEAAELSAAHNTYSDPSRIHLPPRVRRLAFWTAVVATAAAVPYFAAIALYVAAGFSGLPPMSTRILASLSDFLFVPAMVVLVASLASQSRPESKILARLSVAILLIFSGLVYGLRILQLLIIFGRAVGGTSLDLYALNTPASTAAMFAWGPAIGSAVILASRMFTSGGLGVWARRLFVLWGILAIAGWSLTIVGSVLEGSLPTVMVLGIIVRVTSYVFPPASTAVVVWLLRR